MLQRQVIGCNSCVESCSCEFSSQYCPKAALDLSLDSDLAEDLTLQKYREYYQRFDS
ncbi:hypothetical protein [Sporomusa aerivorans]|uniref:hypothetical protein n=1 Tax=Sporomusa aerivorans TaxID=204936 RepID=UPI00352B8AD7